MKIVMLVNHPYAGGTGYWMQLFVKGLMANGNEVATFHAREMKLPTGADYDLIVSSADDVIAGLDAYKPDLVIFQSGYDNPGQVRKVPFWYDAIPRLQFPFTFCSHDDAASYELPHARQILQTISDNKFFIDKILSWSVQPDRIFGSILPGATQIESILPFEGPEFEPLSLMSPLRDTHTVTLFSYVGKVKQWAMLFRLAQLVDRSYSFAYSSDAYTFELCGGAASSPGTSLTTLTFKQLCAFGGGIDTGRFDSPLRDVHKPLPWEIELPNGTKTCYTGTFDRTNVYQKMQATSLTINTTVRRGGSHGPAEYVTLEAIHSGTPTILPRENATPAHAHLGLHNTYPAFQKQHLTRPAILDGKLDGIIGKMIKAIESELMDADQANLDKRRAALTEHHAPQLVAKNILDQL